jgi:hypothetical protein
MGWFKRLLGSEEDEEPEVSEETVDLYELKSWVEEKANSEFENVKPQIEAQLSRVMEQKKALKEHLKELSVAELHNPNISDREKSVMEGNRQAYISQHKQFLNNVGVAEELTCGWTSEFCKDFEQMLVMLAKSTAKGHAVMQAFFANHAATVNKSIKIMGDSVSKIREILEDANVGVENIDEVRKAVTALRGKKKLLSEVEHELEVFRKKLDNSEQMKTKLLGQAEELKQTDSYSQYRDSNKRRDDLWQKAKKVEEEVDFMFSPLSRAMKKYERLIVEDARLFGKYMDSPMKALADDEELKIEGILGKMKRALVEGSLELKDSEKVCQRISEVTRDKLVAAREEYVEARTEIRKIDDTMRNSRVLNDLDDLKYKREHVENQIQLLHDKIDHAAKTKEKIDLDTLKNDAQEKVGEVFGVKLTVVWDGMEPVPDDAAEEVDDDDTDD